MAYGQKWKLRTHFCMFLSFFHDFEAFRLYVIRGFVQHFWEHFFILWKILISLRSPDRKNGKPVSGRKCHTYCNVNFNKILCLYRSDKNCLIYFAFNVSKSENTVSPLPILSPFTIYGKFWNFSKFDMSFYS